MKHAVSNHAALNQVLTHKSFGISQEIRNHGRSGIQLTIGFGINGQQTWRLVYLYLQESCPFAIFSKRNQNA
ncbi:hypothetical protein T07_14543 [Trichinella nelsoni]|uniref:Uncharacterized protein n=1 Tax=Trichinella nelsoni TaxID=6336 RepID=A0A0V0SIR4_9BILA|nr:hypothetical protein T07_14543 [Trichinella nelsoni]